MTQKIGVIGYPIGHSLSPTIHNFWFRKYNINATYEAFEVTPDALEKFIRGMPSIGLSGINLTIPHKENALQYVDEVDALAKRIGAINTIVVKEGKLIGKNTDAYGFITNLGKLPAGKALVIGAGGASRAVCAGLLDKGYEITLINRSMERAEKLAQDIGKNKINVLSWNHLEQVLAHTSLLVNTTPLGMQGQDILHIDLANLPQTAAVTDIVYKPLVTLLLAQAQARGNTTIDGLGMLLYQAQAAFYEWFGIKPEVDNELRQLVLGKMK